MHKLCNNFYIKCLIRSLKEHRYYNCKTQRKIDSNIFRRLKYNNDFLKNVRLFPHILASEIHISEYYLNIDIQNMYMKLISDKFIEDISKIINNNSKKKIDKTELLLHAINKSLYNHLAVDYKISDITLDNSNPIFYPEIITTL